MVRCFAQGHINMYSMNHQLIIRQDNDNDFKTTKQPLKVQFKSPESLIAHTLALATDKHLKSTAANSKTINYFTRDSVWLSLERQ